MVVQLATFKQIVHAAGRMAGGRIVEIIEPGVTPNFLAARIEIGPTSCYVLCSQANNWAFVEAIQPALAPLRFTDCPAFADALQCLFGLSPFTRVALLAPFEKWPSLAECDLRYWKPNTLGDALFNWWD